MTCPGIARSKLEEKYSPYKKRRPTHKAPPNPKRDNGRGEKRAESPRIVEEWKQQAEARREAAAVVI